MFDVRVYAKGDSILGELIVDSYFFEPSKYDYAFYLFKDGERVDAMSYSENMKAVFPLKEKYGVFSIKAFIRDREHGDKRSFYSEKISIDS